jgi:hypothetical protein
MAENGNAKLSLTPRFSGVWARYVTVEPLQRFASSRETAEAVRGLLPHIPTPLKRGVNEMRLAGVQKLRCGRSKALRVSSISYWSFEFVSDFGSRISGFPHAKIT